MPIVEMKKLFLFAHQQERDMILEFLRDFGAVELVDLKESSAWDRMKDLLEPEQSAEELARLESEVGEVRYCLDFLQRLFPLQKSFVQQFTGAKINLTPQEFADYISRGDQIKELYGACRQIDEKLTNLRNEETRCHNMLQNLAPWAAFSMPLGEIKATARTEMLLITVPVDALSTLINSLQEKAPDHYLDTVFSDKESAYLFLIFLKDEAKQVQEILKEVNGAELSFPDIFETPAEAISSLQEKLVLIQQQKEEEIKKAQDLLKRRPLLMAYFDYLEGERAKKEAVNNFARTKSSFLLTGWIPAPKVSELQKTLAEKAETALCVVADPEPGENVPVLLENSGAADAFEVVTRLYSTPNKHELDPTPLMAPFFFVFFGICLSDAGYGIVLSLLALLISRKLKLGGMGRQLIKLLFLGGISSLIFGMLMGSWFGDLLKIKPLWFNPLDDPMRMLIVCFVLGFIQIFFGMGINAYRSIKAGRVLDALFDQGLWYIFLIGLVALAFPQFAAAGKWLAVVGAAGLILTQGRSQKGLFKKFFSGLVSLYNVTGYLSDVLSYSRLLALGLATGVIASAINTMGGLLARGIVGMIVMIIVLMVGHFFNLIISALGSYVHTSRLQYIEFFGKFFEGGGRAFRPFSKTTKYVEIGEREA